MSTQLNFDFSLPAANDPVYSTVLFKRSQRDKTFYGSPASLRQWRLVMERGRWQCKACGFTGSAANRLEVDHIIPVEAGGDQFCLANQQVLCRRCHDLKTAMDALRYGWSKKRRA